MLPNADVCRRAHLARDPRFDGRFVVGVLTTGVFCRPVCPARTPKAENARYFASPAAALAQGYRPCRRCRPEAAPARPAGTLANETVARALRLVDTGYLDDHAVAELATRAGVGLRQLNRLFVAELGATPAAVARGRRLLLALRLLQETTVPIADAALAAGYGSVRACNADFKRAFGSPPSALRRQGAPRAFGSPPSALRRQGAPRDPGPDLALRLCWRPPYRGAALLAFLEGRTIAGLECVAEGVYRRRVGEVAWVQARLVEDGLLVAIPSAAIDRVAEILERLRHLFDLAADSAAIDAHLSKSSRLAAAVRAAPGTRVPGVWDAYEGAVRAVLGQQVSVARATALATKLCERFGDGEFPEPADLARADVASLGMPGTRGRAVAAVARRVAAEGDDWLRDANALRSAFAAIAGVGPWTTEYAAMRVAADPDAFPDSDWGVVKALGVKGAAARRWAEPCRPWRAYATMHLWQGLRQPEKPAAK